MVTQGELFGVQYFLQLWTWRDDEGFRKTKKQMGSYISPEWYHGKLNFVLIHRYSIWSITPNIKSKWSLFSSFSSGHWCWTRWAEPFSLGRCCDSDTRVVKPFVWTLEKKRLSSQNSIYRLWQSNSKYQWGKGGSKRHTVI